VNALPLVPILTALTVAILPRVFSSSPSHRPGGEIEYRYSRGFRLFSWVGSILFLLIPIFFEISGVEIGFARVVVNDAIGILLVIACVYMDRFVVRLKSDCIEVGGFAKKTIYYRDIISAEIEVSGRGSKFLVIRHNGGRVAVSAYLDDLQGLALSLSANLKRTR
jgi:hypothetical protein